MSKPKRLVMATNNNHKLQEARAVVGDAFELVSLAEAGVFEELPETSDTLKGNALQKARRVYELTGLDCFADDTGLSVDALGGAPGVYSARYAGEGHDAEANMAKLLRELEGKEDRSAHFSTVIALIRDGREETFEGRVEGHIARVRSGSNGFGYDPVFVADETGLPFAEMSEEAKNAISHRGRALREMMSRLMVLIVLLVAGLLPASAFEGQWKLHTTFDTTIERLIATPKTVYMLALAQPFDPSVPESPTRQGFLYVYDKNEDELSVLDASNGLTQSVISAIEYNASRGYLLIIYEDLNIDLLFDNGKTVNIPSLKNATMNSSKSVNSVNFDVPGKRIYMATDFGYFVLNDEKGEVYESRIFNEPLLSVAPLGDRLVVADSEGTLRWAPLGAGNFSLSDFVPVELTEGELGKVSRLFPLGDGILGVLSATPEGSDYPTAYSTLKLDSAETTGEAEDSFSAPERSTGSYKSLSMSADGYYLWSSSRFGKIDRNGKISEHSIPSEARGGVNAAANDKEIWQATGRKGLRSFVKGNDGKWAMTRDYMIPDVPSVYISQFMTWHPTYGLLVSNRGNFNYFQSPYYRLPILLSALKDGGWKRYGLPYTAPALEKTLYNPVGLAVDPKNTDHIYFGSLISGIARINLRDPEDVLHVSNSTDYGVGLPGFVDALPVQEKWRESKRMGPPRFDRDGNLWTVYSNLDSQNPSEVIVWPRANIDATKDAKTFKPWVKIPLNITKSSNASQALPLTGSGNLTRVIVNPGLYQTGLILLDHKGTFANTGDDLQITSDKYVDQDGQVVGFNYIRALYEDPSTGLVWVGTDIGLFTLDPAKYAENPSMVSRIKVSRDDGTSLADYLLNGVDISTIISDPFGRKWFGTVGGGVVCTSSDGRQVKGQWTTDNSLLPDNNVYGLGWNEATGSLMVSTERGLAEFFPAGEGTGEDFEALRVFPNPVRPDYHGWVTIDGLIEGALVKLTDAHGGLVRELGRVEGGTILWDVADINGRRVPAGVYYVVASADGEARIGKVLVIN